MESPSRNNGKPDADPTEGENNEDGSSTVGNNRDESSDKDSDEEITITECDDDNRSNSPVIEMSTNPPPTDFPDMTLQQVHEKYLKVGTVFKDRDALRVFLLLISKNYHFAITHSNDTYTDCAQGECRKKKQFKSTTQRIGCPYIVKFKGAELKLNSSGSRRVGDFSKSQPVIITETNYNHTCKPCPAMRMTIAQKSGKFLTYLNSSALFLLANHLEVMPKLNHRVLRTMMHQIFPKSIKWDSWKLTNLRRYVLKRIATFKHTPNVFRDYTLFQKQFPSRTLIEDFPHDCNEERNSEAAAFIWKEMVADNSKDIILHLEKMKHSIEGFDFRFMEDSDKSIIAFVWQTDIMRGNVYRYIENMSLDMRHAESNDLLWPYMSVVLRDEYCKIAIGCEGFCISETLATYKFLLKSMFDMASFASRSDVLIVNADSFLNQKQVVDDLELPNAHFIQDSFFLIYGIFRKNFRKAYNDHKESFDGLLNATTEAAYSSYSSEILDILGNDYQQLSKFRLFLDEKEHHATYIVKTKRGSLGRVSSVPSEQNHSSIQRWQGDGYYANMITCVHDHYLRHIHRISTTRSCIFKDNTILKQHSLILTQQQTAQKEASEIFNLCGYLMFVNELHESVNYTAAQVSDDNQEPSVSIQRSDSNASPRIILESKGFCTDCKTACADVFYFCRHTIVYIAYKNKCNVRQIKLDKKNVSKRYSNVNDIVRIKTLNGKLCVNENILRLFISLTSINNNRCPDIVATRILFTTGSSERQRYLTNALS